MGMLTWHNLVLKGGAGKMDPDQNFLEGPQLLFGYLTFLKTCLHTASLAVSSWGWRRRMWREKEGSWQLKLCQSP
jgi:hypothetical protein